MIVIHCTLNGEDRETTQLLVNRLIEKFYDEGRDGVTVSNARSRLMMSRHLYTTPPAGEPEVPMGETA